MLFPSRTPALPQTRKASFALKVLVILYVYTSIPFNNTMRVLFSTSILYTLPVVQQQRIVRITAQSQVCFNSCIHWSPDALQIRAIACKIVSYGANRWTAGFVEAPTGGWQG